MDKENIFVKVFKEEKGFQVGATMIIVGLLIVGINGLLFRNVTASWKKIVSIVGILISFAGTEMSARYIAAISSEVHRRKDENTAKGKRKK